MSHFAAQTIHSAETMERAIRRLGIVPFFANPIPGYSIQEMTAPGYWFDGEEDSLGPWDWKIECIRCGDIAYGKFLCGGKATFATVEWFRELMNVRRARLTPDENGRQILQYLAEHGSITIKEVRALLGVKKSAADAMISRLQHQCRVVTGDITRIYRGPDLHYSGWQVASFCQPEDLFGGGPTISLPGFPFADDGAPLQTDHTPEESLECLIDHIRQFFPVSRELILKVLR